MTTIGFFEICDAQGRDFCGFNTYACVVPLDAEHHQDEQWHEQSCDPCAGGELGDKDHHQGDASGDGAEAVEEQLYTASGFVRVVEPVLDHAGLAEGKGEKGTNGVERDQPVCDAAEQDEDECSETHEGINSMGEQQTSAADDEDVGQVVFECNGARHAWEVCERCVCAEGECRQDAAHGDVIKQAPAKDSCNFDGEHALVVGIVRIHGGDAICASHVGETQQQHNENADDDGESAIRVVSAWLFERRHTVGNSFNTGHGRTSAGEGLHEQPKGHVLHGGVNGRRRCGEGDRDGRSRPQHASRRPEW